MDVQLEYIRRGPPYRIAALAHGGRCPANNYLAELKKSDINEYEAIQSLFDHMEKHGPLRSGYDYKKVGKKDVKPTLHEIRRNSSRIYCIRRENVFILIDIKPKGAKRVQTQDIKNAHATARRIEWE